MAAGVNITYKILYNSVVAMTGAQSVEAGLAVPELTHKLLAEGVTKIIVCAEQPEKYTGAPLPKGVLLWDRDRLDDAQRVLREIKGVTVLIYDQHCAAEARRKRKRGKLPVRRTRVLINDAVCEGCGDCGIKSNCLSVQPIDTELGRKTRIDQTTCNTDYTCLDGNCPSFVTVEVPESTTVKSAPELPIPPEVPEPIHPPIVGDYNVFLAGIGGTGIVTVNQVLAVAALRAGLACIATEVLQLYLFVPADQVGGPRHETARPRTARKRRSPRHCGNGDRFFDRVGADGERTWWSERSAC
ncbi:hypothetical protein MPRS_18800 [Mycobacterium paraseoulense]|nr:hypothetical protein MPRS_18800 [Mycobacterium paraseoulense]